MKFPLSPGEWLFTVSAIYIIIEMINIFWYRFVPTEYIQMVWVLITAVPLVIPMPKIVRVRPFWS